jgi:hypothetical protein
MQRRLTRPDPYNGFKDDRERRMALNTRARSYAVAMVGVAMAGTSTDWIGRLRWLMNWLP